MTWDWDAMDRACISKTFVDYQTWRTMNGWWMLEGDRDMPCPIPFPVANYSYDDPEAVAMAQTLQAYIRRKFVESTMGAI